MERLIKKQSIAEEQEEFIADFNAFGDWMMQYQCLLELTADMKKMSEDEKNDNTLIAGCQAKLWVSTQYRDGLVYVKADSEALIVKGIVAVIVALFDERTPEEIVESRIDFIERTAIREQISTDRFQGMQTVIRRIRDFALEC